jgi:hypothetical protein
MARSGVTDDGDRPRAGKHPDGRPPTAAEARAEVEARRAQDQAERSAAFADAYGDRPPGRAIVVISWVSTAVLALVTVAAVVDTDAFIAPFLAVAVTWFVAGSALFAVDVVLAAARSRDDVMGIGGLFFLAGSAPRSVQWHLLGSLAAQVVIGLLGAGVGFAAIDASELNTLAFGTLAPVLALSLCGLWGVRHGLFPAQQPDPPRPARAAGQARRG